ncbi:hypothetical protein [Boseongicola sp. H5]|uniref:COG4223 family protein n=1 Tax=Boseongicola sp. H5 TaxID=2763261 RepID=UPI001D0AB582|nr:hypothetical protein [Boseongicola sp. H5]
MARKTSKRSGDTVAGEDTQQDIAATRDETTGQDKTAPEEIGPETTDPETTGPAGEDTVAGDSDTSPLILDRQSPDTGDAPQSGDSKTDATADGDAPEPEAKPDERRPNPAPEPTPMATLMSNATPPQTIVEQRGPGFVPLLLGGVLAAALGYGAAYLGVLPTQQPGEDPAIAELGAALEAQSEDLAALADRAGGIESRLATLPEPVAPQEIDLSPLETALADATATIRDLTDRIAALEARPVLTGEGTIDDAAMAAAMADLQASLAEQQATNLAMAEQVANAAAEAEARIAAAEERAERRVGTATAQAALSQLRIAVAAGNPFSDALADVAANADLDVPDRLAVIAETGVPTLEELQASFPAVARAALPVALRETAGDSTADRVGAFLRGQVGGRSLEPREGDDPDARLSRAEAAVASGDLATALREIGELPEAARDQMAIWISDAQTRLDATDALDGFAVALDDAN